MYLCAQECMSVSALMPPRPRPPKSTSGAIRFCRAPLRGEQAGGDTNVSSCCCCCCSCCCCCCCCCCCWHCCCCVAPAALLPCGCWSNKWQEEKEAPASLPCWFRGCCCCCCCCCCCGAPCGRAFTSCMGVSSLRSINSDLFGRGPFAVEEGGGTSTWCWWWWCCCCCGWCCCCMTCITSTMTRCCSREKGCCTDARNPAMATLQRAKMCVCVCVKYI